MTESAWELFPDKAPEAEQIGLDALEKASQLNMEHDSVIAKCYQLIGVANFYQSRLYTAGSYFQKALSTRCGKEKSRLSAAFWNNLGIIYDQQDQLKAAIHAYNQALDISQHLADTNGMMQRWINLSLLENKLGNTTVALDLCKKALEYANRRQDSSRVAFCHQNLSLFYEGQGNISKSNQHYAMAFGYYQQLGDQYHLASLLLNRANTEAKRGNLPASETALKQGIDLCSSHQLDGLLASLLVQRANNAIQQGTQLHQAQKDLDQAYLLYHKAGRMDKIASLFEIKSRLFAKLGLFSEFATAMDSFVTLTARTTNSNALATYQEMQALYELDRKTQSIQQLEADVRSRNLQLGLLATLLISSSIGAGAIILQHLRLKRYVKTLFQLNSEQARKPTLSDSVQLSTKEGETQLFDLYRRIVGQMELEQWYLDPQLGLQDVATKMGSNQTYISQAINTYSGTNVAGFVNRFRINEARRILLNSDRKIPMTEVAKRSGFSNRVSFYRQFKEMTGFSPTEFVELANHSETSNISS